MYKPSSLPALPRKSCPYYHIVEKTGKNKQKTLVRAACKNPPGKNGWCTEHNYCHDTLCRLEKIGYPALCINSSLRVDAKIESWEEYICSLPAPGEIIYYDRSNKKNRGVERYAQLITAIRQFEAENDVGKDSEESEDEWIVSR
jgi:hypothetical protein